MLKCFVRTSWVAVKKYTLYLSVKWRANVTLKTSTDSRTMTKKSWMTCGASSFLRQKRSTAFHSRNVTRQFVRDCKSEFANCKHEFLWSDWTEDSYIQWVSLCDIIPTSSRIFSWVKCFKWSSTSGLRDTLIGVCQKTLKWALIVCLQTSVWIYGKFSHSHYFSELPIDFLVKFIVPSFQPQVTALTRLTLAT